MSTFVKIVVLATACCFAPLAWAEECSALVTGSADDAIKYLRHAKDEAAAASCVKTAFHQIAGLPSEQAIPILISFLGYKRPLNEGERYGIFMQGSGPNVLYPAVHELFLLGKTAEPELVNFIGQRNDVKGTEVSNTLYALLLIHHGNAVDVIKTLAEARKASEDNRKGDRLKPDSTGGANPPGRGF